MGKDKIKLLFYGDSPTVATGFGTVSKNILTGLHNTGKFDISVLGVNYWGDPHPFPFPIWPVGVGSRDPYGRQRSFDMMLKDFEYDVLFLFQDTFILEFLLKPPTEGQRVPLDVLRAAKKFTTVCYFPVDGIPHRSWIEGVSRVDAPVAYTEFGRREAILACPSIADRLQVIPHGVNVKDFRPLPEADVLNFRKAFFGRNADKFIITNVARNQQRKDLPRTMMAFKEFKKRRPNSALYIHAAIQDMGWNLVDVTTALGLEVTQDVLFPNNFGPNQGYPVDIVNNIYNASDVVVSTTLGEGWGLSSIEAMACKTPIVFPNNTVMPEIVGKDRGYLVKSGATPNDWAIIPHDNEVLRPLTSVTDMADTLVHVYDNRDEAAQRAETAYAWIYNNLLWAENIIPRWEKLILDAVTKMVTSASSGVVSVEDL